MSNAIKEVLVHSQIEYLQSFSGLGEFPLLNILFGDESENNNPSSFNSVSCARHGFFCGCQNFSNITHCVSLSYMM